MTYYPVIIPTLNRYQHFKECVESLAACTHADKTELVIGLDYPPSEKYVEGWKLIKDYIPTITGFAKVTVFEHDHNLGVGTNGNGAFLTKYIKTKYDAWIGTEDDNVFSPCFLDYMDKCLEKYKDDDSIIAVCSYINKDEFSDNQNGNTIIRIKGAFNAWGTGRWKNKEKVYDDFIKPDFREKICNKKKWIIKTFNRPEQFNNFMSWLKNPALNSKCDITIAMTNLVLDKYVIYPIDYISKNMGFDGSGVNCDKLNDNIFEKRQIIKKKEYPLIDVFNSKINSSNQKKFIYSQNKRISKKRRFLIHMSILSYFMFGYKITNKIKETVFFIIKSIAPRGKNG